MFFLRINTNNKIKAANNDDQNKSCIKSIYLNPILNAVAEVPQKRTTNDANRYGFELFFTLITNVSKDNYILNSILSRKIFFTKQQRLTYNRHLIV